MRKSKDIRCIMVFSFLISILLYMGCTETRQSSLESIINMTPSNHASLERVLAHYASDSLKLKAAEFLIANMPYHFSYRDTSMVKAINQGIDSYISQGRKKDSNDINHLLDSVLSPTGIGSMGVVSDLELIDDTFLINHIDRAFTIWKESPWTTHLNFNEFCEWILPYKVQELQPLDNWLEYLSGIFNDNLKTIEYCDVYKSSPTRAGRAVNDCMRGKLQANITPVDYNPAMLNMKTRLEINVGVCAHFVALETAIMRSEGIPTAIDFTPIWSYRNLGHEWNVILDSNGKAVPFDALGSNPGDALKPDERMSKVYRRTYVPNPEILKIHERDGRAPSPFNTPFLKDVTDEYIPAKDIEIRVEDEPDGYVYLALSNRDKWDAVDFTYMKKGKASFSKVGLNSVYSIIRFDKNGRRVISDPFIVRKDGDIHFYTPDTTTLTSTVLYRKYPVLPNVYDVAVRIMDGEFHASDSPEFSSYDLIHRVNDGEAIVHEIELNDSIKPRKYWRYKQDRMYTHCNMAEIEFLDSMGGRIDGKIIGTDGYYGNNSGMAKEKVFDCDPLTAFDAPLSGGGWVGMDFSYPVRPAKITYLGRGDGNSIEKGDLYELVYFTKGKWQQIGRKIATEGHLIFNNVPDNSILLLRNLTKGKEERIFTYENGKQIWR